MAFLRARGEEGGEGIVSALPQAGLSMGSGGPASNLSAFIDQGSEFEGKLTFKDTVRIDGCFRGEITSQNTLVVGETGEIMATVRSRNVIVSGAVTGNIFANERLVLHKTARIEGDVEAESLAVEEGAIINGKVTMGGGRATPSLEALQGGRSQG